MATLEGEEGELEIPSVWKVAQIVSTEPLVKPEGFENSNGKLIRGFIATAVNENTIELEQATPIGQTAAEEMIKRIVALNLGAEVIFT